MSTSPAATPPRGADELVFYDITASSDETGSGQSWVSRVAEVIPVCVAGGIKSVEDARQILEVPTRSWADPPNHRGSPSRFGVQCVVVVSTPTSIPPSVNIPGQNSLPATSRTRTTTWTTWVELGSATPGRGKNSAQRDEPGRHASGCTSEQLKLVRAVCRCPSSPPGGAGP